MKKFSKRLVAIILSVIIAGGVSVASLVNSKAENIGNSSSPYYGLMVSFPRGTDPVDPQFSNRGQNTWGHTSKSFINGWSSESSEYTNIYNLGDGRRVAYCVEPGTQHGNLTSNSTIDWNKLASRNGNTLNGEQVKAFLSQVLFYGYHNTANVAISTWRTNNAYRGDLVWAYATQILVWETIVGERDGNFNHVPVPAGKNQILDLLAAAHPLRGEIMAKYNEIVEKVKSDTIKPSFSFNTRAESEAENNVYEVEYTSGGFSVTLTDTTGALNNFNISDFEIPAGLSCVINGNQLVISADGPFTETKTIKLIRKYNTSSTILYSDNKFEAGNGAQDLIYGQTDLIPQQKEYYVSVECPHIHVFIPHKIPATCIDEGYTVWKCACGISSTDDPVTGIDSHVDTLDHDYQNSPWVTAIPETCVENGEDVQLCSRCGIVLDVRSRSAHGHDEGVWKVDIEATPTRAGQKTRYCTICGEALETAAFTYHTHVLGHTEYLRQSSCTAGGLNGNFCSVCNACYETSELEKTGHTSNEDSIWVTTIQPTCSTTGEKTGYCANCGERVGTEKLDTVEHLSGTWTTNIYATCLTEGEEVCICDACGEKISSRPINALGHDDGVWVVTRPASCLSAGEKSLICTRCGKAIDTSAVNAEGHDVGIWKVDFDATPDHDGQQSRYCSKCDAVLETKTFTYHQHREGYRKNIIDPTCLDNGQEGIFCSVCGVQYDTAELIALGHDYSTIYTNNNSTHSRTCSRCFYEDVANCTFSVSVTSPTCTAPGYTTHTCVECGYSYDDDFLNRLGHDWSKWNDDKNDATHTRFCKRCFVEETSVHIWQDWRLIEKDLLARTMTYQRKCDFCGALQESTVPMNEQPHAHIMEKVDAVPNTCTEDGSSEYYHCKDPDCGKYYSDSNGENEIEENSWIIPAHGHNYVLKESVTPTCTESGFDYYECTYDESHNYVVAYDALNHNYVLKEIVEPTCEEDGYRYYECTNDSNHNRTEEMPAHGHNYKLKESVPSTCTEDGYNVYECINDGCTSEYRDVVPAHGHNYQLKEDMCKDPTPDESGYNYYECTYDHNHNYRKTIYMIGDTDSNKSAKNNNDGTTTITLNAYSNAETITLSENKPVDVVLVLDTSGSMEEEVSGEKKIDGLKRTASTFIDSVAANPENRVAIVSFSTDGLFYSADGSANTLYKSNLALVNHNYVTHDTEYTHSINCEGAMISASENIDVIDSIISGLKAYGATRADFGLNTAIQVINQNIIPNRKTVIVFITDGVPGITNFNDNIANGAIEASETLKNKYGVPIYAVGFDTRNNSDMTMFMNSVSSNYPNATSMMNSGECVSNDYYIYASNAGELNSVFETVVTTEIKPSKPFNDITVFDTVSKEFTITSLQEQAFRENVINEYGVKNEDISVIVNEDGTTSVSVMHLHPKTETDENGNIVKYYVSISFDITANEKASGAQYYNTNTESAGILIEGMVVNSFSSPRVSVPDDRNIVVFLLGGRVYTIAEANIGDEISAPTVSFARWNIPDGFTVSQAYTEFDAEFTSEVKTVTWHTSEGDVSENYHVGEPISVYRANSYDTEKFLGWDSPIPFAMPEEDIEFTALYEEHTHNWSEEPIMQYGSCSEGITYIYACECGETYSVKSEAGEHKYKAEINNVNELSYAILTCENCNFIQDKYITYKAEFTESDLSNPSHDINATNQTIDLSMFNASDISVQPDGIISIVIPATSQMLYDDNLRIYRINEDGTTEDINFFKDANRESIIIEVDHFSYYVITASNEIEANTTYEKVDCGLTVGHSYVFTSVDPTCDEDGCTKYVCSNCGYSYGEESIPAKGHADNNSDGICDECGETVGDACTHICHSEKWFSKIIWAIFKFFSKLFHRNQYCVCGKTHY